MRRLLLLLPLLLVACAGGGGTGSGGDDALEPSAGPVGDLVVEQDAGDGSAPQRWTLVCGDAEGTAGGDHPDREAACAHLRDAEAPFAPLPADMVCTEQYGGPQTARVTGVWRGEQVDVRLSRVDGCRISQWDRLGPLLAGPVGVEPPGDTPQ